MAVVTVTGNAWEHTGGPLPAEIVPELWFRPTKAGLADGALLDNREVKATLNVLTGAFSVQLVAALGILYVPVLSWFTGPYDPNAPEVRNRGWAEWNFTINPYPNGGVIDQIANVDLSIYTVLVSLSPPPPHYRGWYLNAPGPGQPTGDPDDPASSGTGILEIVS